MESIAHAPILRKTGIVLLAVGLLDIAVMVYCVANDISYSSSFNILAVVTGIFLLRGSLRAASLVRWFAVFCLASFASLIVAWPFVQPIDLTFTQIHLNPPAALKTAVFLAGALALLYWLQSQLGRPLVLAAIARSGRKLRDMRVPAAAGLSIVVLLAGSRGFMFNGEPATKAISIAEQKLGPTYRYHVSSLNISTTSQGTSVAGVVTAWKAQQVVEVPVAWRE
jgi:hypothetical protein